MWVNRQNVYHGLVCILLSLFQFGFSFSCRDDQESLSGWVHSTSVRYPESPQHFDGALAFVEYGSNQVSFVSLNDPSRFLKPIKLPVGCGPAAFQFHADLFWITCYDRHEVYWRHKDSSVWNKLGHSESELFSQSEFIGPNDFAFDQNGGTYFTTSGLFDIAAPIQGEVHYIPDATTTPPTAIKVAEGIHYANGLAVIHEGKSLIVSEHLKNRILKFSILEGGRLTQESEIFADLSQLLPQQIDYSNGYQGADGIRLGPDGIIYFAQYAGSRVVKLNQNGELLGMISFKSSYPNITNIWIEGNRIFITAVKEQSQSQDDSHPGIVFSIEDPQLSTRRNLACEIKE